jgi:hypothetical protein
MIKMEPHKWTFRARFRRSAFGWRSQPAIKRIKEAVSEIKKAARKDPVMGAEGAVLFLEKLSPALEQVDSSSGAIGTAVNNATNGWSAFGTLFKRTRFPTLSFFPTIGENCASLQNVPRTGRISLSIRCGWRGVQTRSFAVISKAQQPA